MGSPATAALSLPTLCCGGKYNRVVPQGSTRGTRAVGSFPTLPLPGSLLPQPSAAALSRQSSLHSLKDLGALQITDLSESLKSQSKRSILRLSRKGQGGITAATVEPVPVAEPARFHRHSSSFVSLQISHSLLLRVQVTAAVRLQAWWRGIRTRKHIFAQTGRHFTQRRPPPRTRATPPPSHVSALGVVSHAVLLERFEFGPVIGAGNYAVVKRCLTLPTREPCALKIIDKWNLDSAIDERLLLDEIATMRAIHHPHCMQLLDVFETPLQYLLQLQLVEGDDLFTCIKRTGKLEEPRVCEITRQMADALQYLHAQSIVHRDVKPENIMLIQATGAAVLCDFGLAKVTQGHETLVCGTLSYMAPEIAAAREKGAAGYGVEVDCWALGVVAYVALSGSPPFYSRSKNEEDQFRLIAAANVRFVARVWQSVSQRARSFIVMALQAEPTRRLSAAQMLQHPWVLGLPDPRPADAGIGTEPVPTRLSAFLRRLSSFTPTV
eukprot:m.117114 g.117114  ORF g.117114 m.117114 type:complete len:495 (+) comp14480_c0_seq3:47-1531(+)